MLLTQLCLGFLAIGMLIVAGAAADSGDRIEAFGFSTCAVLLAVIVSGPAVLRVRRGMPARAFTIYTTDSGQRGVRVRYSAWSYAWLVALTATVGVLFGATVIMIAKNGLTGDPRDSAMLLLGIVVTPYCGWLLTEVLRGRLARGQVVLTPAGIHHRYLVFDDFLPWDSISRVAAEYHNGPVIRLASPSGGAYRRLTSRVFGKAMNVLHVEVPARALAADPAALYHAIVYYWRRREARSELVNDSAVHRIRTGNFGLPPQVIIDYGQT